MYMYTLILFILILTCGRGYYYSITVLRTIVFTHLGGVDKGHASRFLSVRFNGKTLLRTAYVYLNNNAQYGGPKTFHKL